MIKSNLEPIEESDLDMEGKLKRAVGDYVRLETAPLANIEREVPREIIAAEKDNSYGEILSKVQSQATDEINHDVVVSDAQAGAQKIDAESQVHHLIDLAQQKGVVHAVKVAQHMQDNYVLDTMHDRMLADQLHDALIAKGMITEL